MQGIESIESLISDCESKEEDAKVRMEYAIATNDYHGVSMARAEWLAWLVLSRYVRAITRPEPYAESELAQRIARAFERIEEHQARFVLPEKSGRVQDRVLANQVVEQYIVAALRGAVAAVEAKQQAMF